MQSVILSSRRCLGSGARGHSPERNNFLKKEQRKKKSIVVCINHAAATENYGNMS